MSRAEIYISLGVALLILYACPKVILLSRIERGEYFYNQGFESSVAAPYIVRMMAKNRRENELGIGRLGEFTGRSHGPKSDRMETKGTGSHR
jgi:hypothetical protein